MFAIVGFIVGLLVVSVVLFAIGSLVFGRGEELAPAPRDTTPVVLPADRSPDAADIEALRLSVVLRGYRMVEVDWVLDQISEALRDKDRQIAALTNQLTRQPAVPPLVAAEASARTTSDSPSEGSATSEGSPSEEPGSEEPASRDAVSDQSPVGADG